MRREDDLEVVDPFGSTSVDHARRPERDTTSPSRRTSVDRDDRLAEEESSGGGAFGFESESSAHDATTAVHQIPIEIRNRGKHDPSGLDHTTTFVDLPRHADVSKRTSPSHDFRLPQTQEVRFDTQRDFAAAVGPDFSPMGMTGDDVTATGIADDDLMSVDDDEVMSIDDDGDATAVSSRFGASRVADDGRAGASTLGASRVAESGRAGASAFGASPGAESGRTGASALAGARGDAGDASGGWGVGGSAVGGSATARYSGSPRTGDEATSRAGLGASHGRAAGKPGASPVPQFLPHEISRAETRVASTPSLYVEPPREESAIHRLPGAGFRALGTVVAPSPSLSRPVNEAHRDAPTSEGLGVQTFVGRVDRATMAAAMADIAEPELLMSGGLATDGTFSPPQEPTRPAIVGYGGLGDPLEPSPADNRRATRQVSLSEMSTEIGHHDEATLRTSVPPEISRLTRVVRAATTAMLSVVLAALSLFALVRSGQLDIEVFRDPERIVRQDGAVDGASGVAGVEPVTLRSVVYPTARGGQLLVFTGEMRNTSGEAVPNLDVVAELRAPDGTVTATARQPLGVTLSVAELSRLDTAASVERAFAAKAVTQGAIAAGAKVPYMVVIAPAPRDVRARRHMVHLVQRPAAPIQVTAPALPDLPAAVTAPATADAPSFGGDEVTERRLKLKAKRMKAKRKSREPSVDEAPVEETP